jgi:GT2 family glycosyltransferase
MEGKTKKINTFIIPTLNNYSGLYRLLVTLEKFTKPDYNVIIINNGHSLKSLSDEAKEYMAKAREKATIWIDPKRNLGFGKAMNQGLKLADTEFVTIANDDVEILYNGWWEEIMDMFEKDENLGGFNPHSPCNKKHTGDRFIQYDYKEEYNDEDIKKMKEIFIRERQYVGCCTYFTICRKKMFDEIGLFDESFGLGSGEDYDLCVRASRKNWLIKGGSTTMVWHWWGDTKDNMPKEDGFATNYDLIAGGNQNMERKWGKHIDKDPEGWSVSGKGGPEEPLDEFEVKYRDRKWYQEVPL